MNKGKKNRKKGAEFERKVRKDLESKGLIVIKNPNNVDLENNTFTGGRPKFNPITKRIMMMSGGFPDFLIIEPKDLNILDGGKRKVYFVECKVNGYLNPTERQKVKWIEENLNLQTYVAKKEGEIKYSIKSEVKNGKKQDS